MYHGLELDRCIFFLIQGYIFLDKLNTLQQNPPL